MNKPHKKTAIAPKPPRKRKRKPISARLAKVFQTFTKPELGRITGMPRQSIHQWLDVPPRHAIAIAEASEGLLTKEFLAPEFYPPAPARKGAK